MSMIRLLAILILTKSITQGPIEDSNSLIECLNLNSLYMQIILAFLFHLGEPERRGSVITIPMGMNMIHTLYLNTNILQVIKGLESFSFR